MKKLLIASLVATLALFGCKKQETPEPAPQAETQTAPETTNQTDTPPADTHDHAHDDHAGHAHEHHAGEIYQCDNDKTVSVAIHDHEGEIEAHATIDDIEYDLSPVEEKENAFISLHEGLNDKGMKMLKDDKKLTFTDLDDKPLLGCTLSKTL